jgi:16S rRNA processing protein RimM
VSLEENHPPENRDWVAVAVLGRTRGNRGELTAAALSSRPERYAELREVWLFGAGERYEVESVWFHGDRLIFKFRGIDTISDAEPLAGAEVRIPRTARIELEPGEFFESDLVGCAVVDAGTGGVLGRITGFRDSGWPGLLEIDGDWLIPFARSICREIDPAGRRVLVELPEGLRELNRR